MKVKKILMYNFDFFSLPKKYFEDVKDNFHSENSNMIFVDDYINEIQKEHFEFLELHHLEELKYYFARFASFYSRLKNATDKLYGELVLERLLDEADMAADGIIEDDDSIAFKRIESSEFEKVMKLFEEEE